MTLYCETTGNGPDLVLLHGWGLHGGLFAKLAESLSGSRRIHRIDRQQIIPLVVPVTYGTITRTLRHPGQHAG